MKQFFTSACLFLIVWSLSAQNSAPKYVMIEHFTNSRCSICASKNPAFYSLIDQYPSDVHHLAIHPAFPYVNCIFHQYNTIDNNARTAFYPQVNGTPTVVLNGQVNTAGGPLLSQTKLLSYIGQTSPIWVEVTEAGNIERIVTVKVHTLGAVPAGTYKIFGAVAEKLITLTTPNGETKHHDVFRRMLPDNNGIAFTPAPVGQFAIFEFDYSLSGLNAAETYALIFVQNMDTKEILNSGTKFDPDVSATQDIVDTQSARLAPNPATDQTEILLDTDEINRLEVLDMNGKMLLSQDHPASKTIATSTFSPGLYMVKITGEKAVYTARLLKN